MRRDNFQTIMKPDGSRAREAQGAETKNWREIRQRCRKGLPPLPMQTVRPKHQPRSIFNIFLQKHEKDKLEQLL